MGVLSDTQIAALARDADMIHPFTDRLVTGGRALISYGLSSYGYDALLANEFKVFGDAGGPVIDPKAFDPDHFATVYADEHLDIPPHGFVLGRTVERFSIPRDVIAICYAKSTYARCGIVVGVTPLEPQWQGTVTLEFSNTTSKPARIYPYEGICQFVFHRGVQPCATSYADRKGKYQGQTGVTLARV